MKTIDEQLNIINDTKNGIAQVLNSKGVEVTADTKFADYPDKVAQLMGNAEVDASVSAALTEVTAEYLEQVNAVKAQADGLEESKLDVSVAEATYQPIGNYLTEHQDISGKLDVSVAAETYQPKGAYLTEHQDISGKLDASVAEATYQPKGDYLTEHQDISGKLDASVAAETYQPKGNYQPAGNYLTEHQDISGKLDASVAAETYQPKGAYLTEHQSLADYALKSELPLVPTNVSAFTNDAGYLTSHQDISNLLDVSTAAATYQPKGAYLTEHQDISGKLDSSVAASTYATKQEIPDVSGLLRASDVITESHDSLLMTLNRQLVSLATIDYLSTAKFHGIYMEMSADVWTAAENNEVELLYVKPFGSNTATVTVLMSSGKPKIKMSVGGYEAQYDIPGVVGNNVRMFVPVPNAVVMADLGMLGTGCRINSIVTKSYLVKFGIGDRFDTTALDSKYLTSHQDISGKLDASVAAETYATKAEVNNAGYLTSHQDISGKLDTSVAASTYALKADSIYAEGDVSTNHGATDDLSTTPVTFTCDKMKFTCEGGWSGMANTSEKSVGLTITCDEGTVKLIKLNGVFTLTTAYAWNEVTEANTITTVKESNFTYNLNEITFNDKVTLTNVTAVTVNSFGSNVQMTTTEHVVTTVKQKIAQLEALIATLHPQS